MINYVFFILFIFLQFAAKFLGRKNKTSKVNKVDSFPCGRCGREAQMSPKDAIQSKG